MNDREIMQIERFERSTVFAEGHASYFVAGKPSGENVEALRAVLAQLRLLGATQTGSAGDFKGATGRKNAHLEAVRLDMVGLADVARQLHEVNPDLQNQFKMPPNRRDLALLNSARSQLGLLTDPAGGAALVELFTDYGMPDDFVSHLQNDVDEAGAAALAQEGHLGDRHEDTLAIDAQIELGIRAMGKLDAYCKNKFRDDSVLAGAWKTASHLELRHVHPRKPQ